LINLKPGKSVRLLLITAAGLWLIFSCADIEAVLQPKSAPNEFSTYFYSAATLLYFDYQFSMAEAVYRLALKYDSGAGTIKRSLYNTIYMRAERNEIPLSYFEAYADSMLSEKLMNQAMLEQAYNIFIQYDEKEKARQILNMYLKSYTKSEAYSSLYKLEKELDNKKRPQLLDKAVKNANNDASILNTLGFLYLEFDADKAEKIWISSLPYDSSPQAATSLWNLYATQSDSVKLRSLYSSFRLPAERDKLYAVLNQAVTGGTAKSLLYVHDLILRSADPQFVLKLMLACWSEEDYDRFEQTLSAVEKMNLTYLDRQLAYFYAALNSLKQNRAESALLYISRLDGKYTLDELLTVHRAEFMSKKPENDTQALKTLKSNMTRIFSPAKDNQLPWQIKDYLMAAVNDMTIDNQVSVPEDIAKTCVQWYFDEGRRTYDTFFWLAKYYQNLKNYINLNAILREALEAFPEDASLLNWLGYNYIQRDYNLAEAEVMILRALQLSPDNPFFLDSLAWLHFNKGDYEKALKLMKIPSQMLEMPSEIAYHLARVHIALKQYEQAMPYLNRAVEANDDPEYVRLAKDALRQLNR